MSDLFYQALFSFENLHGSWRHVRKSADKSANRDIQAAADEFETESPRRLRSIQSRLVKGTFKFAPSTGILKDKAKREKRGKAPRPIVLATLESRVVQRAILQVLQPSSDSPLYGQLNAIRSVNESSFGVGGIPKPYGGVSVAISSVVRDISQGAKHFYKSDIKSFFTRIPHAKIAEVILEETGDREFARIFSEALSVEISNRDQLGEYFDLFPRNGVGVPQGSSLSAFAGNVLLFDLDHALNTNETSCYRYIDDLIILGRSQEDIKLAVNLVTSLLSEFKMALYHPAQDLDKAEEGAVERGFTLLGCNIRVGQVEPSRETSSNLLFKIDREIKNAKKVIQMLIENPERTRKSEFTYHQSLSRIDRIINGWGHSLSFCNNPLPFKVLDQKIDTKLVSYADWFASAKVEMNTKQRRRATGIALLQDVERTPIRSDGSRSTSTST